MYADQAESSFSLDAVIVTNTAGRITDVNERALSLTGFSRQWLVGMELVGLFADRRRAAEVIEQSYNEKLVHDVELELLTNDAETIPISLSASLYLDYDRDARNLVFAFHDISERKRAEREQALLASLVQCSDDAIIALAPDSRIMSWNHGAQKLFGFTAEEAIGQSIDLYLPPETRPLAHAAVAEDLILMNQDHQAVRRVERRMRRKDGSLIDVSLVVSGVYDGRGALLAMSSVIRDITEWKKAEREQSMLAAIVASSEDAIITKAPDRTISTWNSGAEKLYGYSAKEAIGRPVSMLVPPDRRDELDTIISGVLLGETIHRHETKRLRKDGTLVDVSLSESPVRDASGAIVGVAAIERDIGERLRARQLESQMAAIVKSSGDAIYSVGPGHIVQSWNGGAERTLGYSANEVIGKQSPAMNPDMRPQLDAVLHRVLDQHETVEFESRRRRKDGVVLDVAITASPIYDSAGKAETIAVVARDITEHKRLQQQLEKREEYYRSLIEGSSDVVLVIDMAGKIVFAGGSQERIFQSKPEEVQGTIAASYIHPDDLPEAALRLSEIATKPHVLTHSRIRRKDGSWCDCESLGKLVTDRDGEQHIILYVRDITERKRMERELVAAHGAALAASRAKSEFLSSMSHEIRTPMNAILGMAELLAESELSVDQRRYLEVMSANGDALLELINSILDMAKIESGRLQIEQVEFDLSELIDKTISTFGVRAHGKGLELAAGIAPGVPERLVGDPLRLRQVLINLIGNAVKFTELGEIVLMVDHDGEAAQPGALRFTVSDTGIGIAPDQLEAIFSSFTQADSSTTRKYGGSGLGLAIAQRLVGLMGGRIRLESELGRGSRFSFTARFGLASRLIAPRADVVLSLAGYRALVVDDNHVNRLIVSEMIGSCGSEVSEADSGEAALAAVCRARDAGRPYQIILLDMRMPGMDGLEVARRLRAEHLPVRPLVLMLSSDDLKPQLSRLKQLGLSSYLVKPVTRRELFEAIRQVLQQANHQTANALPARHPAASEDEAPAMGAPIRILVAEDSPDNRMVVKAYLRRAPYELEFAENGRRAVELFQANRYALVLMDMQMPELDGFAATAKIRQWERSQALAPTPIVALTASVLEEDVRRALNAGCNLHLGKPIKKPLLLEVIRNLVSAAAPPAAALPLPIPAAA